MAVSREEKWYPTILRVSHLPLAIPLEHMHKMLEINRTKIKGGSQSGRKVVTHSSKSDLPLAIKTLCVYSLYRVPICFSELDQNTFLEKLYCHVVENILLTKS